MTNPSSARVEDAAATGLEPHRPALVRSICESDYPVVGSSIADLRDAVTLLGPKRGGRALGAVTSWALRWTFEACRAGARFRTARITVAFDAIVTLPRWEPLRAADAATRAAWNVYVAALAAHEAQHVAIADAAVLDVLASLRDLEAESPSALHREGDRVARERVARARAEEARYDVRTRYGGTQGARLGLTLLPRPLASRCA